MGIEPIAASLVLAAVLIFVIFSWMRLRTGRVLAALTAAHPDALVFAAAAHPAQEGVLPGRAAASGYAVQVVAVVQPGALRIYGLSGSNLAEHARTRTAFTLGRVTTVAGTFSGIDVVIDGSVALRLFPQSLRNRWFLVRLRGEERSELEDSLDLK